MYSKSSMGALKFQSTHPMRGATKEYRFSEQETKISIHAPARGATCILRHERKRNKFQSTHPRGVRRTDDPLPTVTTGFQSTHPRGVRHAHDAQSVEVLHISIHAPARGATQGDARAVPCPDDFNPRTREGCDVLDPATMQGEQISIHAPARGATSATSTRSASMRDFNPRTPCGVRRDALSTVHRRRDFNPRTPCGVRLGKNASRRFFDHFNPRTPCGVRRYSGCNGCLRFSPFQSTHPMRGATPCSSRGCPLRRISIHAPHAGCDVSRGRAER